MVTSGSSDGQEPARKRNRNPSAHSGTQYNFLPEAEATTGAYRYWSEMCVLRAATGWRNR